MKEKHFFITVQQFDGQTSSGTWSGADEIELFISCSKNGLALMQYRLIGESAKRDIDNARKEFQTKFKEHMNKVDLAL